MSADIKSPNLLGSYLKKNAAATVDRI